MSSRVRSRGLPGAAIAAGLLAWVGFLGCGAASETPSSVPSHPRPIRPIRPDRAMAAMIGRQALEEYGYEEIIRRAVKAHFLRYPDPAKPNADNLVGQTMADAARQAWPVFTRWAVMAGITSQMDSPAPGPADVVAIGELVVGLVYAGAIAVMVLTMSSDKATSTTTTTTTEAPPAETTCPALAPPDGGPQMDVSIEKQLAGKGQLKDLRTNPNFKGVDLNDLLRKTPRELQQMAQKGEITKDTCRRIMKAFEGRDLAGRGKNK